MTPYPVDAFHVEALKEAIGAEVRILEQELREQTRRDKVREAFRNNSRETRIEQLGRRVKPATFPRAPVFYTEETKRSGHQR